MTATDQVRFGYNTPAGERRIERIDPRTFARDLQSVCDVACQIFDAFWVPDHIMRGDAFRLECWTQLTWLAARYPTQMLGTVVMANSYRHPPLLAKMASSIQHLSHGRLILGYGAGWLEDEYRAYGYGFPSARVRIAQMVEGIQLIRALWTETPANYQGTYYQVSDARCEPRPDPIPPIMIGGDGERFLLRAVAEHADSWLCFARDVATLRRKVSVLEEHCREVGRDPSTVGRVCPMTIYLARTRAEAERRAGAALEWPEPAFAGDPPALRARIEELTGIGFRTFVFAFAGFPETDDLRLFADEVVPHFR